MSEGSAIAFAATVAMLTQSWCAPQQLSFDQAYSVIMASIQALENPTGAGRVQRPPLAILTLTPWGHSLMTPPRTILWLHLLFLCSFPLPPRRAHTHHVAVARQAAHVAGAHPSALFANPDGSRTRRSRRFALLSPVSALVLVPLVPILKRRGRPHHYALLGVSGLACLFTQYIGGFYLGVVLTLAFLLAAAAAIRVRLLITGALRRGNLLAVSADRARADADESAPSLQTVSPHRAIESASPSSSPPCGRGPPVRVRDRSACFFRLV